MSEGTQPERRFLTWSAACTAAIAVLFVIVGAAGILLRPPGGSTLSQVDPYLAIHEVLMLLSAISLVIMMASLYRCAPPDRRIFGLTALAFTVLFAALTCAVHFVSLTVGRQIDPGASPWLSHQLVFDQWPTLAMSLDLLAWDFFLGLALLFAAQVFTGGPVRQARISMIVAGTLCLAGALGPASGRLEIQYLGIAGYAFALPVACTFVAILFRRG